ncbi:NADH-ubiquinone oxidoreductase chain D [Pyrodictium delaneyi]|uniref:NADH-quinone oxidoreductase subunit D n=1 Tax=Pyrodictium delaneyi TaxID=1273541 RepID=A0A0P0N471_9CREN|nr:nickel-dependent hydrogenase large subunit [Pyrodictium delaneyi]ALL01566.1 NADH-ubiquinone oxidoreductase chain D [Pyrodictium delaneyi]OWJ54538.1 NADH-quinone oxidoreductase subunit D [Pyrodictium delaneyi]
MPVIEVSIGPQHPALHEPIMLRVRVDGEDVVGVEVVTGYNHRGIEKLAESNTFLKTLYIVTRVCGICNMMHSNCYVQAIEEINGIEPPPRAQALRVLAMELERLHSHMLLAAVVAEIAGFESLFMLIMRDREKVMHLKELLTGNRVIADYVWPGGVRRDLSPEVAEKIRRSMDILEQRIKYYMEVYTSDRLLRRRLEGIGVIPYSVAVSHGLVGPTARGSGVDIDVRRDDPYAWYGELDFQVIRRSEGDALARMLVRFEEALESINIIRQVLEKLPSGPINSLKTPPRRFREGEAISRVEAPRGELLYHVVSRGGTKPYRVKIRTPSIPNILNSLVAYQGATLADIPVILASLDPCISCMERVIVVDERTGRERLENLRQLARRRADQ